MPGHENDISWHTLRQLARDWLGASAELAEVRPLDGGSVNCTLCLTMACGLKAVLKVSPHRVTCVHVDEALQLEMLRRSGMPVPQVYAATVGSLDDPFSYILMEYVDGVDLATARRTCSPTEFDDLQRHLAGLLLTLHQTTAERYARVADQGRRDYDRWPDFFRDVYGDIWNDVEQSPLLPVKCRKLIGKIHERLPQLLAHDDRPRLVHWDVWSTNVLARPTPAGWRVAALLDPNCKYAHAEAELAYLDLFHTATPAFFHEYQRPGRLATEYHRVRKLVYQLYQCLNHVRLFGKSYVPMTTGVLDRLAAVV